MEHLKQTKTIDTCIQVFEQACKRAGLKITHQRTEVFKELTKAADHPSAETIYGRLKKRLPTLSIDTVYRTLTTLEKQGLISKVQTVESQARYEFKNDHHHHLICDNCHEIIDFNWPEFDKFALPPELSDWGQIKDRKVILHGLCHRCAEKTNKNTKCN
jgi:Fur family peroxide stress response transcriptional regulator